MSENEKESGGAETADPKGGSQDDKAVAAEAARARKAAEEAAKPAWEQDPKAPERIDASMDPLVVQLRSSHPDAVVEATAVDGETTLDVERMAIEAVCQTLRSEHGFSLLVDVFGVDYPDREGGRFEVVYHLFNVDDRALLRLKIRAGEDEEVPTVSAVWRGANWCEREIYDMYGVRFAGHPDMTRILLWEGFNGHPLRKDFPVEGVDTGAAIYPELYGDETGPVAGTGTGWRPPAAAGDEEPEGPDGGPAR